MNPQEPTKIIGIDLGTTFSLVAEFNADTGTVTVIGDESGSYVVPSVVYYPESGDPPVVGHQAINAGAYAADRVVSKIKMNMGTDFRAKVGDREYTPAEVSAEILKKLKKNAEAYLNVTSFKSVVITVPAYFTELPCAATEEAVRLAGFDMSRVRLFPEPCAAALAYVAEAQTDLASGPRRVLVSDLGGGTYDATIIETTPFRAPDGRAHLKIDVVCKEGSQELGGVMWDQALEAHVKEECAASAADGHSGLSGQDATLAHALRERVTTCKIALSDMTRAKVPCCTGKLQEITRETFEDKTAALLFQVETKLRDVLETDRKLQEKRIEDGKQTQVVDPNPVLLAGGASHMPQVKKVVRDVTGHEPMIHRSLERIVAIGAAYEAAITGGVQVPTRGGIIIEQPRTILGVDIGILATRQGLDVNAVVLSKGEMEGNEISRDDFVTSVGDQSLIEFVLLEGMSHAPKECVEIGKAELLLPPGQPQGTKVKVTLMLGESGTIVGKGICFTTEGPREAAIRIKRKQL